MTEILTPKQVASQTGFSEKTLANWRVLGQGPRSFKVGRLVRYYAADVNNWIEALAPTSNVTPLRKRA